MTMESQIYFRRKQASKYLHDKFNVKREPSTLAKLAVTGGGPPYRLLNRVPLYTPADLDQWVASMLGPRMHSTSGGTEFPTEHEAGYKSAAGPATGARRQLRSGETA
jgi:hypothetical protein